MTTLTLKINENSKKGKAFLEFAKTFFDDKNDVVIIKSDEKELKDATSVYNPEFVNMVLDRFANIKSGKTKCTTLDPNDVWGSLGLK